MKFSLALIVLFSALVSFSQDRFKNESISFSRYKKENPEKVIDFGVKGDLRTLKADADIHYKYSTSSWHFIRTTSLHVSELIQEGKVQQIYFSPSKPEMLCDTMRIVQNVDSVHMGYGPLSGAFTGKDVIIGYVDSGLDYNHDDFKNADGSTRVLYYWDQTLGFDPLLTPTKYGYGQVWDSTHINAGTITSMDNSAHGTTVTGAGSGNGLANGKHKGVAPESDIIIVESDFSSANWTLSVADAIDYVFSMADTLGKPAVVNTSLGTYLGSHDGLDPASEIVDSLLNDKAGRIVVAAGGNSGNQGKYHVKGTVTTDTSYTWFEVNPSSGFGSPSVYFDMWADTADFNQVEFAFAADNTSPAYQFRARTQFYNIQSLLGATTLDSIMVGPNKLAPIEFFCEEVNGVYHIEALMEDVDSADYLYRFETTGNGEYDLWSGAWIGASNIKSDNLPTTIDFPPIQYYHLPDTFSTIVSSWTCLPSVVTVANITNRKTYIDWNSNTYVGTGEAGELSVSSSKGPSRTGHQKPDVAANGDLILASCPLWLIGSLQGSNPDMLDEGGLHVRNGGTSMASPVIAGIAALYLEKCPEATYQQFMDDLFNNAYEDSWTQSTPNVAYGHGKIDAFRLLVETNFNVTMLGDSLICDEPMIFNTQEDNFAAYDWSSGETTNEISVNYADTIFVTVTDSEGCRETSDSVITIVGTVPTYPVINELGGGLITTPADSIQWYFEGVAIDSSNAQFHNPDTTGNFTVEVFGPEGCSFLSEPFWVDLSMIEELEKNEFIILPNPFKDYFSILKSDFYDISFYVSDLSGKIVYDYTEYNSEDLFITVDLSAYQSGSYFLTIYYADNFSSFKLIKE